MKFFKHMIMNQADDLLGGGGNGNQGGTGGDNPPANGGNNPPANNAPPAGDAGKAWYPENWKELLPDELKNDPSIKALKDPVALAKSYIHGQKLVGKDKIIVPDQHTSEDQWKEIYTKLGLPEQDKYEFQTPEGADAEFVKQFKEFGYKNGILPKQAEKFFGWFKEYGEKLASASEQENQTRFTKTVDSLKREWGQAYDKKLANASGLFKQFADEDTRAELREIGFSNHPKVLKLFAKIADSFGEGKFVAPGGNGAMGITPAEAQQKINSIYANPNHAYFHKMNPQHEDARAEMKKLHEAVLAGKKS